MRNFSQTLSALQALSQDLPVAPMASTLMASLFLLVRPPSHVLGFLFFLCVVKQYLTACTVVFLVSVV